MDREERQQVVDILSGLAREIRGYHIAHQYDAGYTVGVRDALDREVGRLGLLAKRVDEAWDDPYKDIHDAVVRDNDRAMALLRQCLDEMDYAGWGEPVVDQQGRRAVFNAVREYLGIGGRDEN